MPKVSEKHRAARRDQIVDAALRCFSTRGFQRTSMADIIAESGLSAGAIYGHFESKQQLVIAVAQRILGNRMAEFGSRLETGELPPPSFMLRLMMEGLRGELRDTGVLLQLWGEAVTDPEMSGLIGPIFQRVRGLIGPYLHRWATERRGLGGEAAEVWANDVIMVVIGIAQGYVVQSALLPGFDGEAYLRGVSAILDGDPA
ncbi:MAG: TetR/AcrR family transcriptional regulator [Microbacteriaceae bacterium]|nr:TetR/AcrR family transcriptional regulator [Microbacteriaceae bacterium]